MLIRQRRLVKVSEELVFHPEAIGALWALLADRKGTRFQVGEFKIHRHQPQVCDPVIGVSGSRAHHAA